MIYYISDLHFGHKNILAFDNRPWFTVKEMDRNLIERWNSKVTAKDIVYVLGDFSWYNRKDTEDILKQLNGEKALVLGNHDIIPEAGSGFDVAWDYVTIFDDGQPVILSHYPIASFNGMFDGWVHLYGHVHNSAQHNIVEHLYEDQSKLYAKQIKAANVGCMMPYMDYTPRTLEEIKQAKGWR